MWVLPSRKSLFISVMVLYLPIWLDCTDVGSPGKLPYHALIGYQWQITCFSVKLIFFCLMGSPFLFLLIIFFSLLGFFFSLIPRLNLALTLGTHTDICIHTNTCHSILFLHMYTIIAPVTLALILDLSLLPFYICEHLFFEVMIIIALIYWAPITW